MRLFLAVSLDPSVRAALAGAVEELRAARAPIRWVKPENLHLTLKFLGETSGEKVPSLTVAMEEVARNVWPFDLSVLGAGVFPATSRPRVVWADVREPTGTLLRLFELIEEATGSIGWKRERRGFSPHITLGRVKGNINMRQLAGRIDALRGRRWGDQGVGRVTLYRSHPGSGGVRYEVVRDFTFRHG
jgi:2'-5' RNA ligase